MLPFILVGVAGMISTGAKKAYDGLSLRAEAVEIGDRATAQLRAAEIRLEGAIGVTVARISDLQRRQELVRSQIMSNLAPTLARVTNVDRKAWRPLEAAAFDGGRLSAAWGVGPAVIGGLVKDTLLGVAAGAALGQGAMAAAGSIGVASTDIAIGELTGVAASNASLAWLGGGALSAGGWGMAGGALALNALMVGPGALFAGLALAKHGQKRKTGAVAYAGDVDRAVAREALTRARLEAISARVEEVIASSLRTSVQAATLAASVNRQLDRSPACGFAELDGPLQDSILMLGGLTGLLNALAGLRIIDEAGDLLRDEADDPVSRAQALLEVEV